jgi:DNA polymerase-3 subunit gamma/tau
MSDTYKALTRKYRPRTFDDIVSQRHVSETLANAIDQKRLNHAYLFTGPRGVGKTTMARVLARKINGIDDSVDGELLGQTLDIIEIDAASNNGVDDVHRVRDAVRVPPQTGTYKVFIIDEVHMLSKPAFNALLKTLEEPPPYIIFIFATTEPHKVLPTVLSRCQRFDFRRIKVAEIVERLRHICREEGITADDESLHVIASKADGALRDALSLMDQAIAFCGTTITHEALTRALNIVGVDTLFAILDGIRGNDAASVLRTLDDLLVNGNDLQELLISFTEVLRNLYMVKDAKTLYLVEVTDDTLRRLKEAAAAFTEEDILRMMHLVSETQFKIRDAPQPRVQAELMLLKLATMPKADGLNALLAAVKGMRSAPDAAGGPAGPAGGPARRPDPSPAPPRSASAASPPPFPSAAPVYGSPAIKRPVNALHAVDLELAEAETPESGLALVTDMDAWSEPDAAPLFLHDIQAKWSAYLDDVRKTSKMTVAHSLVRSRPIHLQGELLTLECDDEFTLAMLTNNQRELMACWRPVIGRMLSLEFVLNDRRPQTAPADPFETFRRLQKEDPKLKMIVDLLGAELDL